VVLEHRGLNNLRGPFTSCLQVLMQRPQGERYIRMFQEHSQELITIYINHPQLWEPTGALLQRLAQPASTLSRADTASMETGPLLGAATLDVLLEVLDSYAALAGRDLAADLDRLAASLTELNGLTAEQVLERLGPRYSGVSTARRLLSARPQTTR